MINILEAWLDSGAIFGIGEERVLIGYGKKRRGMQPFVGDTPSFYFPDYFLNDPCPWFQYEEYQEMSIESLLSQLASMPNNYSPTIKWKAFSKSFFDEIFCELQREIKKGTLVKAVPFITEIASITMQRGQLIQSLRRALHYTNTHRVYLYGFWESEEGMLGMSPEILFEYDESGKLTTMACAGTCPIEEEEHHLLSDSKEAQEHQLVVEGIVSSLAPYGSITVGNRNLLKLSKVMHLVTPIEIHLDRPPRFTEMVQALHPTPAVGAFPKKEGTIWLEKYQQKIHRDRFGAPAGYRLAGGKKGRCCVAIRNVQWTPHEMKLRAGCGIVGESQQDREWAELQLKLHMIKEMLAL